MGTTLGRPGIEADKTGLNSIDDETNEEIEELEISVRTESY